MEPIETTQHALEFAGPAAPGWLLALIPAALIIVWSLYRYQFKDIGRFPRTGLLVLRCLTVAGILFLVFRPIIVFRRVLTYPGRILMVIDDSESMSTADNRLSPRDALYVARRLDTKKADVRAEYHKMAELLRLSVNAVKRFQEYSRKADRRLDAFWTEAERIKAELTQNYDAVEGFLEKPAKDPAPEAEKQLAANLDELCQKTTALFAGERHPGREQFDALYEKAASIMAVLLDLQAALDAEQLAQPAALQRRYLAEVQASKRTDLLAQALTANLQKAKTLAGNQFLVCISLMTGQQQLLGVDSGLKPFATVRGETDLVNALTKLAVEENSFPLTAIVLLSDGRDLGKGNLSKLKQELTRRRIPLHAAGIGDLNEPYDLAVVDVVAPPLAVKGEKVTVKAHLKAVLPEPRTLKLSVLGDGQLLTTTETLLGKQERQDVDFTFIPQKAGISLYSITAETMQGEAFPRRNNKADFAMDVRTEPVRVLLLDWKPRWETRFACTVLRNLGYVELNQIILMAQPNELKRGVGRGCWPDSFDALNMYDLLILGDVPDSVLTEAELSDVRRFVQDAGKAICLLSPETPAARQLMNEFIPMPKVPAADSEAIQLAATPAGQVHPMSYRYMPDEHATPHST